MSIYIQKYVVFAILSSLFFQFDASTEEYTKLENRIACLEEDNVKLKQELKKSEEEFENSRKRQKTLQNTIYAMVVYLQKEHGVTIMPQGNQTEGRRSIYSIKMSNRAESPIRAWSDETGPISFDGHDLLDSPGKISYTNKRPRAGSE